MMLNVPDIYENFCTDDPGCLQSENWHSCFTEHVANEGVIRRVLVSFVAVVAYL